jgi:hypothetical protein
MTIEELFDTKRWRQAPIEYIKKSFGEKRDDLIVHIWNNRDKKLSPLTLYTYLKARFGSPKGSMMLMKNCGTTENLIHWHYHLLSGENEIHFVGKSSGIEVWLKLKIGTNFTVDDWDLMVQNLKSSYSNEGVKMKLIQKNFERYTLFINPFTRLDDNLRKLKEELKNLDINEVKYKLSPNAK